MSHLGLLLAHRRSAIMDWPSQLCSSGLPTLVRHGLCSGHADPVPALLTLWSSLVTRQRHLPRASREKRLGRRRSLAEQRAVDAPLERQPGSEADSGEHVPNLFLLGVCKAAGKLVVERA